jgi:hypothetical protein
MYKLQTSILGERPVQFVSRDMKPDLQLILKHEREKIGEKLMLRTCSLLC